MKKKIILVLALTLTGMTAEAQKSLKESAGSNGMGPKSVEFAKGAQPDFVKGQVMVKDHESYKRSTEVVFKHSEKDMLGQEHFRYQQKIKGIPVDGTTYVVHVLNGKVKSQNGVWVSEVPNNLASTPAISEHTALEAAMKSFGVKVYKWQLPDEEKFIKRESGNPAATFLPKAELVYYSGEDQISPDNLRLAYKLDLYAHEPVGRRIYFVDAMTGAILGTRELLHTVNTNASAVTGFNGTQTIMTDSYSGSYRLRETGRGNGIQTYNLGKGVNYSTAVDFTDTDTTWNNANADLDQYATDAHWGAEKTYDYFKNTFNRNSIDDAGFAINSYVHYSTSYFNAFWDGTRMTYGDGNSSHSNLPLTSVDVCGHEITHGLTAYTAGLNYSNESGALNEGFSDLFGTTIEYYAKPTSGNWLIGEAFSTLRSMSNPNAYGQPDTYKGSYWYTGTADYGGVHTNSGVINFWYYLLAAGGSGTNDNNTPYTVSGIGLSKAAAIAYRTLTVYLVPTSQYADARTYSIQSATDLYGANSNEVAQVTAAWIAVGVGATVVVNNTGTASLATSNAYGQSFTAPCSGNMLNFSLNFTSLPTATYHIFNLAIYSGSGCSGTAIYTSQWFVMGTGLKTYSPTAPITLTQNQVYTFVVTKSSGVDFSIKGSGNAYSGGNCIQSSSCTALTNSDAEFAVSIGSSTRIPQISVQGNSNIIPTGSSTVSTATNTDFSTLAHGTQMTKTYTIQNIGDSTLVVSGITKTGVNQTDFSISGITFPATIPTTSSTTFTVTFTPSAPGTRTSTLHVASNDQNDSDYYFAISGCAPTIPASGTQTLSQNVSDNSFDGASCSNLITNVFPCGVAPVSGNVSTKVTIDNSVQRYNGSPYVQRHYDIEPSTNASTSTGNVTLYYTQAEFNAYNATAGIGAALPTSASDLTGISHLRVTQYHGTGTAPGYYSGFTGTGPAVISIDPLDNNIIYNSAMSRWEVTFSVTGFSGFYLSGSSISALPIHLSTFTARKIGGTNTLSWKTATETSRITFDVERSNNGSSFTPIATLVGIGIGSEYSYDDIAPQAINYYRLKMREENGEITYSNTIVLKGDVNSNSGSISVTPIPASSIVTITNSDLSQTGTTAVISDLQGRIVYRFTLSAQNQISVANWPLGIYILRLNNGDIIKMEKQ